MSETQLSLWGGVTGADIVGEIEKRGFAEIRHNIPAESINELVEAHAVFTDSFPEPEAATMNAMITNTADLDSLDFSKDKQAQWHKYRSNVPHFAKPNGHTSRYWQAEVLRQFDRKRLNRRSGQWEEMVEDPKEFFHYTPDYRERLKQQHEEFGWGPVPAELMELSRKMQTVHYAAKTALASVFGRLEQSHPQLNKFVRPEDLNISPVRSLRYYRGQGDQLAEGHHDRGLFTMQIADSHRGLRIRNPQTRQMDLVETPSEVSPVFPAIKWKSASPDSTLKSLWHDVINDPAAVDGRELYGENIARYAIIFFVNSRRLGERINKTSTHSETEEAA